jgi:hypothetical protein
MTFRAIPIHDAVLAEIHISWEADRCDLRVHPVGLPAHWLVFEGFTNLEFPKKNPWGPSCSINTLREPQPGEFEIELQSGDVLRVRAGHWAYRAETAA